ncbi:putative calponin domain-containing protein [Monocercomonoides exilis]|uniref:putative calponin domain-containing protein n=1 Tax=Monocercomonoides exilis TaxID=2049356 RepID=UPI00355954FD|nr:putative calponin domain-containing protein [Monocercomonoides exilis]|eukprot:MONOS_2115.1-p1 / transcript=MONOS_2115.1 / gene=MONOS_2115 / organism=Monocercomonoides_exilis_PA203 / gene_product=calponin domain-containing protein / transcript_product=calponin domain-containing protein / location=Mono_scaffold00041:138054-139407(-) / protein_length=340 / sequence_SO=supercontig / SO=protein_coding / is_pseudo=false
MSTRQMSQAMGLDAEAQRKMESKYDKALEAEIIEWIEKETGSKITSFLPDLKSGVILCNLINKFLPGSVPRISKMSNAFQQMENLSQFLSACRKFGLPEHCLFRTVDVYENDLPMPLLDTLITLRRHVESKGSSAKPAPKAPSPKPQSQVQETPKAATSQCSSSAPQPASPKSSVEPAKIEQSSSSTPSSVSSSSTQPSSSIGSAHGFSREIVDRVNAKLKPEDIANLTQWIEAVLKTPGASSGKTFGEWLHSGVVLCQLVNTIKPGTIKKINMQSSPFFQRENINNYLLGCRSFGLNESDLFRTDELFEERNMTSVVQNLLNFARLSKNVPGFSGPYLG